MENGQRRPHMYNARILAPRAIETFGEPTPQLAHPPAHHNTKVLEIITKSDSGRGRAPTPCMYSWPASWPLGQSELPGNPHPGYRTPQHPTIQGYSQQYIRPAQPGCGGKRATSPPSRTLADLAPARTSWGERFRLKQVNTATFTIQETANCFLLRHNCRRVPL
jgi:hypothetical protein